MLKGCILHTEGFFNICIFVDVEGGVFYTPKVFSTFCIFVDVEMLKAVQNNKKSTFSADILEIL